MPSENLPTALLATPDRPTVPNTSLTRLAGMPLDAAIQCRWARAVRLGCTQLASSRAPTLRNGVCRAPYGCPATSAVPDDGLSRPRIIRIVVDLPAPLGPRNPVTVPGCTVNDR